MADSDEFFRPSVVQYPRSTVSSVNDVRGGDDGSVPPYVVVNDIAAPYDGELIYAEVEVHDSDPSRSSLVYDDPMTKARRNSADCTIEPRISKDPDGGWPLRRTSSDSDVNRSARTSDASLLSAGGRSEHYDSVVSRTAVHDDDIITVINNDEEDSEDDRHSDDDGCIYDQVYSQPEDTSAEHNEWVLRRLMLMLMQFDQCGVQCPPVNLPKSP